MTGSGIDFIHHVGLIPANADIDRAIAAFERLGFMFTPLSKMEATVRLDAPPVYIGLGNRNGIFEEGFLEIVGAPDPDIWARVPVEKRGPFNIDERLRRYAGLHIITLGANEDIEVVRARYLAQSQPVTEVAQLQRKVETPEGERLMQAKVLFYAQRPDPEAIVSVAQHVTPQYALQPRHMQHANGARRLTEVVICADAPEEMAAKYARYTGHAFERRDDLHVIDLGRARITVVDPVGLRRLVPGYALYPTPFVAAFTVATPDLQRTRDYLRAQAVAFNEVDGRLVVSPGEGCGSAVLFESFDRRR